MYIHGDLDYIMLHKLQQRILLSKIRKNYIGTYIYRKTFRVQHTVCLFYAKLQIYILLYIPESMGDVNLKFGYCNSMKS